MLLTAEARPPQPPWPGQPHREREPGGEAGAVSGGEAGARSGDAPGEAAAGVGVVPGGTRTGAAAGSAPGGIRPGEARTGPVPGGSGADPEQPRPRRPRDAGAAAP